MHNYSHRDSCVKKEEKTNELMLACFRRAALPSVLKLKGADKFGDCNLFLQAVKDLELLAYIDKCQANF